MSEMFWICSDCGSANLYPDVKECDVCGKQIDDYEIKQAEEHFKEALRAQERIKRNEKKEAQLRKRQDFKKKKRAKLEQRQKEKKQRLQEKEPKKKKTLKKYIELERRFLSVFSKSMKILKNCIVCLLVLSIFVVGILVVSQENLDVIGNKMEKIVDLTVIEFKEGHYTTGKDGDETFKPFKNIEKQYKCIVDHFEESKT